MIIQYDNNLIEMNDEWSHKSFTSHSSVDLPNDINVYMTSFSQEIVDSHVFSDDLTGVTFYNCNLDNVFIPPGNIMVGGSNRSFEIQNDLEDWVMEKGMPIEPVNKKVFIKLGLSIDPKDIPAQKVSKAITYEVVESAQFRKNVLSKMNIEL